MYPNFIVVRIDGQHFKRFSEVHKFEKTNGERGLKLMNACACAVLEEYPDVICAYGYSDEFSCATLEVLQAYLIWRQSDCRTNSLFNTCLYNLIKSGKNEAEAQSVIKETRKQDKNELLFQQFGINYEILPAIFRQGSFIMKGEVMEFVKYSENGSPIKRSRSKLVVAHSENVTAASFWNAHLSFVEELGSFSNYNGKCESDFFRSFRSENKLMLKTWIVVRIDGCHFHRFSDVHGFEKQNDKRALNLMNSSAVAVLKEFADIIFAYGVSDEYSFVLSKDSQMCQRLSRFSESVALSH